MADQTSLTGLRETLRTLPVGDVTSIAAKVDVQASAKLHNFRKNVQATVAKIDGTFVTHSLDTLVDDFRTAIRCIVIQRTA